MPIDLPIVRLGAAPIFDAYIFVDWSAAAEPILGHHGIWIAEGSWNDQHLIVETPVNPATRDQATRHLVQRITNLLSKKKCILFGADFAYSYPAWFFTAQNLLPNRQALWAALVQRIEDNPNNNANNRFTVAGQLNLAMGLAWYWGVPNGYQGDQPPAHQPDLPPGGVQYRWVENHLRGQDLHPHSVRQLYGNGSVGSQSLMGIPRLHQLQAEFGSRFQTWPFDTAWAQAFANMLRPTVVNCEIWPRTIPVQKYHAVPDAAEMLSYVVWAAQQDADGNLMGWLDVPHRLPNVPAEDLAIAQATEGWILGC